MQQNDAAVTRTYSKRSGHSTTMSIATASEHDNDSLHPLPKRKGREEGNIKTTKGYTGADVNTNAVDVIVPPPPTKNMLYNRHPYLLYFTTREVEQRYYNFQYVDNSFAPGKMFAFLWGLLIAGSFVVFTAPFNDKGAYMIESFSNSWWLVIYPTYAINFMLFICMYIAVLKPHREALHLAQIFCGWPSIYLVVLVLKQPYVLRYAYLFGSTSFTMFVVQARVCRVLPFITIWPLICLFTITFSVPHYWDTHTKIEMLYWLALLAPTALLIYLEKQVRQSFVDKEVALQEIAESEHKTAVTQKMIANFFPATPTRDLLQHLNGPRDKAYEDTVLIVTDIAGFTAYTSRSDPADVIAMLTDMFQSFDSTACQFGVEKIATVGDSYCGAVFPPCTTTTDISATSRCINAIQFSCAALPFAGYDLQLRIGVHIGDIVGVFVGCLPPKFDLFGPGIDHARIMEEEGRPGYVHISTDVLLHLEVDSDAVTERTKLGALCTSWGACTNASSTNINDYEDTQSEDKRDNEPLDSANIVSVLCSLSNVDSAAIPVSLGVSHQEDHSDGGVIIDAEHRDHNADATTDEDGEEFAFHPLLLVFKTESIERQFRNYIYSIELNLYCSRVYLGISFGFMFIQLNIQCGAVRDMAMTASMVTILATMSCYLAFVGTSRKYHFTITILAYNAMMMLGYLMPTSDCDSPSSFNRVEYIGDFGGTIACISIFAAQYCLDSKLLYRTGATMLSCVVGATCIAIRQNTIGDSTIPMDPLPVCGMGFAIMSFFPEYSLRSAFQSELQLRKLRKAARSRGAAMATSALSIMLPTFVTERIVALSKRTTTGSSSTTDQTTTDSHTINSSPSTASNDMSDLDINGVAATWEYSHAVLMFVKFYSSDPSFTPSTIHATVQAIEQIMTQFEVMKVKTIGSTVMLVAGIDDPRTRQEQLTSVIDAAIMIRESVMPTTNITNMWYRIGIHCGPCFGAVIGGNGAIFDLFGDTVNTASRMTSTAPEDGIQLSSSANALILPRLREYVHAAGDPVVMKGKGAMEVYHVDNTVPIDHLPDFVRQDF